MIDLLREAQALRQTGRAGRPCTGGAHRGRGGGHVHDYSASDRGRADAPTRPGQPPIAYVATLELSIVVNRQGGTASNRVLSELSPRGPRNIGSRGLDRYAG